MQAPGIMQGATEYKKLNFEPKIIVKFEGGVTGVGVDSVVSWTGVLQETFGIREGFGCLNEETLHAYKHA